MLVIGVGLAVHLGVAGVVGDVVGDALYAVLIYLLLVCALPRLRPGRVAASAIIVCTAVELMQLTGIPRMLAETVPPSALVLGSGFDARDLVVYAVAAGTTGVIDSAARRRRDRRPENTEGALPEESAF